MSNRHERRKARAQERKLRAHRKFREGQQSAKTGQLPPAYVEQVKTAARLMSDWAGAHSGADLRWKEQADEGTFIIGALPDLVDFIADSPDARRMLLDVDEQTGRQLTMSQTLWALRLCRAIPMPDGTYWNTQIIQDSYALQQLSAFARGKGATTRVPETPCPHCGVALSAASDKDGRAPGPGDLTVCMRCGGVCVFTETLTLRALTESELAALPPEHRAAIEDMAAMVRQMRAQRLTNGPRREVPEA